MRQDIQEAARSRSPNREIPSPTDADTFGARHTNHKFWMAQIVEYRAVSGIVCRPSLCPRALLGSQTMQRFKGGFKDALKF